MNIFFYLLHSIRTLARIPIIVEAVTHIEDRVVSKSHVMCCRREAAWWIDRPV